MFYEATKTGSSRNRFDLSPIREGNDAFPTDDGDHYRKCEPKKPPPSYFSSPSSSSFSSKNNSDDDDDTADIPWEDRKPAAKTYNSEANGYATGNFAEEYGYRMEDHNGDDVDDVDESNYYDASPTLVYDLDIEAELPSSSSSSTKDGVLFPRNSPKRMMSRTRLKEHTNDDAHEAIGDQNSPNDHKAGGSANTTTVTTRTASQDDEENILHSSHHPFSTGTSGGISRRELLWVASVFCSIVVIGISTTFLVLTNRGNGNNPNEPSPGSTADSSSTTNNNGGAKPTKRLSIREEWELVYKAIYNNPLTRPILFSEEIIDANGDSGLLPEDPSVYSDLVSGMIFSEVHRDWIPEPYSDETDDFIDLQGMTTTQTDIHHNTSPKHLTPHQKATSWLLYHDSLKDPKESVWRWALASIYFRMGGPDWTFSNSSTIENRWFTASPICDWEGLGGCTSKNKLPLDLELDDFHLSGSIPAELVLLQDHELPGASSADDDVVSTTTILRSITLTDNQLTGTIPGRVFQQLLPSLGKLYLDHNQLTGTIPSALGGLDSLYVQHNNFTGDWPEEFCAAANVVNNPYKNGKQPSKKTVVDDFGLDCDKVECSCCGIFQCYYS